MVSNAEVRRLVYKYGIDTKIVSLSTLKKAIGVELEHRALIGHDPEKALIIALAHLQESPRYYQQLSRMEKKEENYWKNKEKPSIFIANSQVD
jgi:hypothetical protein